MKIKVININGKETGRTVELSDTIFNIEPNDHAIYLDVKQHLANKRQGTHKAKERSEITGSTRKLRKQKGSGAARIGSVKSPILRGGGRAFGPRPRNYGFKLNKKVKQLARRSALSYKTTNKELIVIEDFTLDKPQTKEIINIKKNLNIENKKTLFVFKNTNKNVWLSTRNIKNTETIIVNELNTYKILNNKSLIISETSVDFLNNILS